MTRKREGHTVRVDRWVEQLLGWYEEMSDRGFMAKGHESGAALVRERLALGIERGHPGSRAWRTTSERAAVYGPFATADLRPDVIMEALKLVARELRRFSPT